MERPKEQVQPGAPELPQSPQVEKVSHIRILVVHLVAASTEYAWQVPKGVKSIHMHVRDGTAVRVATEKDVVATPSSDNYYTIIAADTDAYAGGELNLGNLDIQDPNMILYFATAGTDKFVEIIVGI